MSKCRYPAPAADFVDEMAVTRKLNGGDVGRYLSPAERLAAVRTLVQWGYNPHSVSTRLKMRPFDVAKLYRQARELPADNKPADDLSWQEDSSCRGRNPDLFTLNEHDEADLANGEVPDRMRAAARVHCADCPVLADCEAWATRNEHVGLSGGRVRYVDENGRYRAVNPLRGNAGGESHP